MGDIINHAHASMFFYHDKEKAKEKFLAEGMSEEDAEAKAIQYATREVQKEILRASIHEALTQ